MKRFWIVGQYLYRRTFEIGGQLKWESEEIWLVKSRQFATNTGISSVCNENTSVQLPTIDVIHFGGKMVVRPVKNRDDIYGHLFSLAKQCIFADNSLLDSSLWVGRIKSFRM